MVLTCHKISNKYGIFLLKQVTYVYCTTFQSIQDHICIRRANGSGHFDNQEDKHRRNNSIPSTRLHMCKCLDPCNYLVLLHMGNNIWGLCKAHVHLSNRANIEYIHVHHKCNDLFPKEMMWEFNRFAIIWGIVFPSYHFPENIQIMYQPLNVRQCMPPCTICSNK